MSVEPKRVEVFVTSFGPFLNVKVNPSEAVMWELVKLLPELDLGHVARVVVAQTNVLKVTPSTVKDYVSMVTPQAQLVDDAVACRLFVHLGVHRGGQQVKFERIGLNNLHCPHGDADGVVCSNATISASDVEDDLSEAVPTEGAAAGTGVSSVDGDAPVSATAIQLAEMFLPAGRSWLTQPVASFVAAVRRRAGLRGADAAQDIVTSACGDLLQSTPVPVAPSVDAGAYLCNFTLYQSLRHLSFPRPVQCRGQRSLERVVALAATSAKDNEEEFAGRVPVLSLFVHVTDPTFYLTTAHSADKQAVTIATALHAVLRHLFVVEQH